MIAHFLGLGDRQMAQSAVWKSLQYCYATSLLPAIAVCFFRSQISAYLFKDPASRQILETSLLVAGLQIPVDFTITTLTSIFV